MCSCGDKPSARPVIETCHRCHHSMAQHVVMGDKGYWCRLCRCRRQYVTNP